ncbi:uncharacterized protein ColSpa_12549 [Colletotrichum spaethianum]|uniref:Formylmethionine deformylase-like protein n=1 Tax=Colletotrichum spaethianum TaxID=700344 RepID=A0AA37UTP7_9PEZI|nr:uncharacterized protein ColSpa_12549 [Colletotrichum spaethianum]GKT52368.1 hypothetical protein ColSpa_12549 [Colletotrichum spaethianum]
MDDQGLGLRENAAQDLNQIPMTPPTEWHPARQFARKPIHAAQSTATTPAPIGSPLGPHGRSPPTPSAKSPQPSFSERAAGAAAYFPAPPSDNDAPSHQRPRPAPLQMHPVEYSNYSGSYSSLSTPYTGGLLSGGLPPKRPMHARVDSQSSAAGLLSPPWQGPPPTNRQQSMYYPPEPVRLYNKYWHPSWNMYFFLFAGIAFALGHHFFYARLDGTVADGQIRMLRYGAALSFLSKASLASAVILAFRQRVWMTVRRKMLTLGAVDSLFAAAEDMTAVFNIEIFRQARVAMILAIYVWCTPLVVVLTSDTLTAQPATMREDTMCPSVRTLDFAQEETNDFRTTPKIENLFELSVSMWNTTSLNQTDEHFFDYWIGTSWQFEEISTSAILGKKPMARTNAGIDICGMGYNCSFSIKFQGPGYKCEELASGVGATPKKLNGADVPFNMSMLAPVGNHTYIAHATLGEYQNPQMNDSLPGGIPTIPPPFPPHLGALRTEPVLFFGYAHVDDPSADQPSNNSDPRWQTAYTPKVFGCEHRETEYEVDFKYSGQLQTTHVRKRTFLDRVVDTRYLPGVDAVDGTADNTTATPESNYILPKDVARYRRAMAYHSIGLQFRNFVNGTIFQPNTNANTRVLQTRILDQHNYLVVKDFMAEVQSLYEDVILSMFAQPRLLAVVWANDTSVKTGNDKGTDMLYPCTRERTDIRYRYHARDLWAVYSVAILLAVVGVAFGVAAVREEGLVRNTRFSSIVAATRGPGLEKLPWATTPNSDHRPVAAAKVGYGLVPQGGAETYGFGVEGDVKQPQKEDAGRTPSRLGSPFQRSAFNRRWSRLSSQP